MSRRNEYSDCVQHIHQQPMKKVKEFQYLGSIVTKDARCTTEIKRRIGIAKTTFRRMSNLFKNGRNSNETRTRAIKTYILPTLLYGCEAWTISKEMEKRLEAMEMWCLRRMLRVSWTERRSNTNILEIIGGRRELLSTIWKRQIL